MSAAVGLINYGSGNFRSVLNALRHLSVNVTEVTAPEQLKDIQRIILPGVGAFGALMKRLQELRFTDALKEEVLEKKKPYLGICVGMQILAEVGTEFETIDGLNFTGGRCELIAAEKYNLRVPHIGWNEVYFNPAHPLFSGLTSPAAFYFVHSFHIATQNEAHVIGYADYGEKITACIGHSNIFGVQFHPEKSQRSGLQLLKNFSQSEQIENA